MRAHRLPGWFRAALLASLPVIVIGMIGLGIWQLNRLQERRAHNALIQARLAGPPLTLTAAALTSDLAAWEYRPARARGVFDPAGEIIWRNQARDGAPGVHVLTPLRLADGSAVLVDRGWIPYTEAEPAARARYAAPAGVVEVSGVLRLPVVRTAAFLPADPTVSPANPRVDAWFWTDLRQIQTQLAYPLLPVILVQNAAAGGLALPAADSSVELSDGPHLWYALQWFAFAAIAFFGPLIYWRHSRQARPGPPT